jgi:hypothetical protein
LILPKGFICEGQKVLARDIETHDTNARLRLRYWESCSSPLHKAVQAELVIPRDTAGGRRPSNRSITSGGRERTEARSRVQTTRYRATIKASICTPTSRAVHWTPLVQDTYIDIHELGAFGGPSLASLCSNAQSASCVTRSCRLAKQECKASTRTTSREDQGNPDHYYFSYRHKT